MHCLFQVPKYASTHESGSGDPQERGPLQAVEQSADSRLASSVQVAFSGFLDLKQAIAFKISMATHERQVSGFHIYRPACPNGVHDPYFIFRPPTQGLGLGLTPSDPQKGIRMGLMQELQATLHMINERRVADAKVT